jgi:hypothetical protein
VRTRIIRTRGALTRLLIAVTTVAAVVAGGLLVAPAAPAEAADASQFDPGYIISDDIFYNSTLMSDAQVQAFLVSKETNCAATAGNPGCMKDYRLDTPALAADGYCDAYQGGTNELASHVLYNVAQACHVNPQVLLVLLQKEQGLITATNPSAAIYRKATGYGCPDTNVPNACDSRFYGYLNQLFQAGHHFHSYVDPANNYTYQAGRSVAIAYKPSNQLPAGGCASPVVHIQNNATAALYDYTPYQPNPAALANLYGGGDACSSYGNRNFWAYFTDWFGSTTVSKANDSFVRAVYQDVLKRDPADNDRIVWGKALTAGMPRSQVAGAFVNSDEFRRLKIDFAYTDVLGRPADSGGELSWLNGMRAGTLTPDDVYRIFLQTPEYYNSTAPAGQPATDQSYVAAMYQKIIKRPAVQSEIDYWVGMLHQYGQVTVVNLIWFSTETARARVSQMYQDYLGRAPDYPGLVQWGGYALQYGDGWVRSAILGSDEYLGRATTRYP